MAEATAAKMATKKIVIVGEPTRIQRAWLWTKAMLAKAKRAVVSGATKVRVVMTRVFHSTAAAVVAAGVQGALATQKGWNVASRGVAAVGRIAGTAVVKVAKAASWVGKQAGRALGWIVGRFHKETGQKISDSNKKFADWRSSKLDSVQEGIDRVAFGAQAAMSSKVPSRIGRTTAGVLGAATLANVVTKGAVAAKVAGIASVGGFLSKVAFGPASLLVTGAVAVIGGLAGWMFRREDVNTRIEEMLTPKDQPVLTDQLPVRTVSLVEVPRKPIVEKVSPQVAKPGTTFVAPAAPVAPADITEEVVIETVEETAEGTVTTTTVQTPGELTLDITNEGDTRFEAETSGPAEVIENMTPEDDQVAMDAGMLGEIKDAGVLSESEIASLSVPDEISDEVVLTSFRQVYAKPKGHNGHYTDDQIEKRRKALFLGNIAMPVMDAA